MNYKKGQCCLCPEGTEEYIVKKLPSGHFCQKHNKERLDERKGLTGTHIPKSSIKPKRRKITGELEVFKAIWATREHKSQISGETLGEFSVSYFSHILSKGAYGRFRLYPKNIILKTHKEHQIWETQRHKIKEDPLWKWIFELHDKLKYEYYNS